MTLSVGNAPCSWGTLEFSNTQASRITYETMLDELAETGYTGTELGDWGFMPTDATALAETLRQHELDLTGAFIGVALADPDAHESGMEMAVKTATLLADTAKAMSSTVAPFLVLADDNCSVPIRTRNAGSITEEMGLDGDGWQRFAHGAESIARAVQDETGLRTVFHHHCGGYVETPDEIARLLDLTDNGRLGLVFDTGHYAFGAGGCDGLLQAMTRFRDRIDYVHFKDYDPAIGSAASAGNWDYFEAVRQGIFCELGQGCVDFAKVVTWLQQNDYNGYVTVEQDILPGMGTPKASAARNRAYLMTIGL